MDLPGRNTLLRGGNMGLAYLLFTCWRCCKRTWVLVVASSVSVAGEWKNEAEWPVRVSQWPYSHAYCNTVRSLISPLLLFDLPSGHTLTLWTSCLPVGRRWKRQSPEASRPSVNRTGEASAPSWASVPHLCIVMSPWVLRRSQKKPAEPPSTVGTCWPIPNLTSGRAREQLREREVARFTWVLTPAWKQESTVPKGHTGSLTGQMNCPISLTSEGERRHRPSPPPPLETSSIESIFLSMDIPEHLPFRGVMSSTGHCGIWGPQWQYIYIYIEAEGEQWLSVIGYIWWTHHLPSQQVWQNVSI